MKNRISAIVLAAGSGSRMNSKTKKQFINVKDKPIIWYSLFAFENSEVDQIIIVTSKEDVEYCRRDIVQKYNLLKVTDIVVGGNERYESVYNGLERVEGDIVLVHDGARPMLNEAIINRCIEGAKKNKACVVGMPVKDTIKIVDNQGRVESTPNRNKLWITQTPQGFEHSLLVQAYEKMKNVNDTSVTDDSMVVEKYTDCQVQFVEGEYSNIKITTPEDIALMEALLSYRK